MATKAAELVPFEAPEVKTDLKPIKTAAVEVVERATVLTKPRSAAELEEAAAALVAIKKQVVDPAEAVRKHLNEPVAETKKRNDTLIHDTLTVGDVYLPDLEQDLRAGIVAYRAREYDREQRKAQKALDRLAADALSGDDAKVVAFVPGGDSPKRTIKTAEGSVSIGARLKFAITDEAALPEHCFMRVPNSKLIEGLLASGQDVPGVAAVYELNTTVR